MPPSLSQSKGNGGDGEDKGDVGDEGDGENITVTSSACSPPLCANQVTNQPQMPIANPNCVTSTPTTKIARTNNTIKA